MTIPTCSLPAFPSHFLSQQSVRVADRLDCTSPRGGSSLQPIRTASVVRLIQLTFCRTLATLFLIGSAVSIAAFRARSQSSLFCADATSKFLCACAAESVMISDSDFVLIRLVRKSKAEVVLTLDISMSLTP